MLPFIERTSGTQPATIHSMRTISIAIPEADYEVLRRAAQKEGRPIAQLILDCYRQDLPVFSGHKAVGPVPDKYDIYEEIWSESSCG